MTSKYWCASYFARRHCGSARSCGCAMRSRRRFRRQDVACQLRDAPVENAAPRIFIFRVYAVYVDEMILGEDDKHLDFRASVWLRSDHGESASVKEIVLTTVVHCHNLLGRCCGEQSASGMARIHSAQRPVGWTGGGRTMGWGFNLGRKEQQKADYKINSLCVVAFLTAVSGMPVSKVTSLPSC